MTALLAVEASAYMLLAAAAGLWIWWLDVRFSSPEPLLSPWQRCLMAVLWPYTCLLLIVAAARRRIR